MEQNETNGAPAERERVSCERPRGCGGKGSNKIVIAIWVTLLLGSTGFYMFFQRRNAAEAERLLNRAYELYGQMDFVGSTECLRQAAERGNAWAQVYYGGHLKDGIGTPPDAVEAVKWFRRAAAQNCPEAFLRLGECYEFGECVGRDLDKAAAWYRKARKHPEYSERAQSALDRIARRKPAGAGSN